MGGGGGIAGAVAFPAYIADSHAYLIGGSEVDADQRYVSGNVATDLNVAGIMNSMWSANPWTSLTFTNPTTNLDEMDTQFNLYFEAVTGFSIDNYSAYVEKALYAIAAASGGISDLTVDVTVPTYTSPTDLFLSFATQMRAEIVKTLALVQTTNSTNQQALQDLIASASSTVQSTIGSLSISPATTLWNSMVSTVVTKLADCSTIEKADLLAILQKADANAKDHLRVALRLVRDVLQTETMTELVTQYKARRSVEYQSQVSEFAGQMSDLNAVNSTGFLFGTALLRSEQMREVADFEAQFSAQVLTQGLSLYVQAHASHLQAGTTVALENAKARNDVLKTSIQILGELNTSGEVTSSNLLGTYSNLFQSGVQDESARLNLVANLGGRAIEQMAQLYGRNMQSTLVRENLSDTLELEAGRINKAAKENRYSIGLQQVAQILTNKTEFQRLAAALLTEQKRLRIVAREEYETASQQITIKDALWNIETAHRGTQLYAAPSGMAAALPESPSRGSSAIGGALQGAGAGAALGTQIGAAGGPIGALGGAAIGAGLGLLGGLFS